MQRSEFRVARRRGGPIPRSVIALAAAAGLGAAGCGSSTPSSGDGTASGSPAVPTASSGPAGTTTSPGPTPTAGGTTVPAEFSGMVDIGGGRSIFMECRGSGTPTVVLVAGLGERADNWSQTADPDQAGLGVFPEVATFSRVCAYDRPGTATATASGWEMTDSTPVPQPITAADAAADLDTLLKASGEAGPYVLVGHSFGGDIVRLYAGSYPATVAGVVLDDALSENLVDNLTPAQLVDFEQLNSPDIQGKPAGSESFEFATLVQQMQAAPPIPDVPMVILTADTFTITPEAIASGAFPPFVDQAFVDALWSAQLAAQDKLAASYPNAQHITETNATHYIHVEQPQIVVDAIRDART